MIGLPLGRRHNAGVVDSDVLELFTATRQRQRQEIERVEILNGPKSKLHRLKSFITCSGRACCQPSSSKQFLRTGSGSEQHQADAAPDRHDADFI